MEQTYTVKQISEIIGKSKVYVQQTINKLGLLPTASKGTARLYSYDQTLKICQTIKPDMDSLQLSQAIESYREVSDKLSTISDNSDNSSMISQYIEDLRDTIENQREQLAQKDIQIQELSDRLDQQQRLMAMQMQQTTKQIQMEQGADQEQEQSQRKISFWDRITKHRKRTK